MRQAARLAGAGTVFYVLPPLMALLVCGTIAQRTSGLYEAQKTFFGSFVLWLGPVPLPGGYTLIALAGASLLLKFLFFSPWSRAKAGINIVHLGILVLLSGALLTAVQAEEGFMTIPQGQQSSIVADYHRRELAVIRGNDIVATVRPSQIVPGRELSFAGLPFKLKVRTSCRDCQILRREIVHEDYGEKLRGMAQYMALAASDKPTKEDEARLYGATLSLSGPGGDYDGTYVIFDLMPNPIVFEKDGATYQILYRKVQRDLPFSLRLDQFTKEVHPGTGLARAYSSAITVIDGGTEWPVRIAMNSPLRYKGYTFFQSSFATGSYGPATVLAVVRNKGWVFPYLGTALIALGLVLHLLIAVRSGRKEGAP